MIVGEQVAPVGHGIPNSGARPARSGSEITDTLRLRDPCQKIICFAAGTLIRTPSGERRIEKLRPGDEIVTLDRGPQVLRWIGRDTVRASGQLAPILFSKGVVGNYHDLRVSPWHKMIWKGAAARKHFGQSEVLATARSLVDDCRVTVEFGGMVTYVHLMFDRHEVVIANGAPSESFHPGGDRLNTLPASTREDLFRLFPKLRSDVGSYGPAIRACVEGSAARALLTA